VKPRVLFIDDEPALLDGFRRMLRAQTAVWDMQFMSDPVAAWDFLQREKVEAVVSDVAMPRMSGLELLQRIRKHPRTHDLPVAILTGLNEADLKLQVLDLGATDLLSKPLQPAELLARLRNMLRLKAAQDELKQRNCELEARIEQRTRQVRRSRMQIIWRLSKAADFRDEETGEHVLRVACYSAAIAETLGLPRAAVEKIFVASPLHDIGKIAIPDAILLKPGKFTDEERRIMQTHCELGRRILYEPSVAEACAGSHSACGSDDGDDADDLMAVAQQIASAHHERWDGTGYPSRLAGTEIPLFARIVSVADVYDALRSTRPYKSPIPPRESLEIIMAGRKTQFDPDVVDAFLLAQPRILEIQQSVQAEVGRLMAPMSELSGIDQNPGQRAIRRESSGDWREPGPTSDDLVELLNSNKALLFE
jgi:putative two-component system response regulator